MIHPPYCGNKVEEDNTPCGNAIITMLKYENFTLAVIICSKVLASFNFSISEYSFSIRDMLRFWTRYMHIAELQVIIALLKV